MVAAVQIPPDPVAPGRVGQIVMHLNEPQLKRLIEILDRMLKGAGDQQSNIDPSFSETGQKQNGLPQQRGVMAVSDQQVEESLAASVSNMSISKNPSGN
jgi:hypothetical protein